MPTPEVGSGAQGAVQKRGLETQRTPECKWEEALYLKIKPPVSQEGNPPFGPKRKLSGPRLHLTPHRLTAPPPHPTPARPPAPPRPGRPERGGGGLINLLPEWGRGRLRETRGEAVGGRPFPTPRPCRPCPGSPALPPGGGASRRAQPSTPQRRRPARRPRGTRRDAGRPGCGGRARSLRGPPARGLAGTPTPPRTPTPARAGRAARAAPAPAGPRPPACRRRPRAPPRPPGPQPPAPRRRPLSPFHSVPGLARAGKSPASHQSERRWQWTRKLGCRCYCSPLGSGESLSLSGKRGPKGIFQEPDGHWEQQGQDRALVPFHCLLIVLQVEKQSMVILS
ncbi:vegetative cell wall protein gp1-like [Rousettus aegyptiacus]|uniref:vegetative cell wall protein gp1-like n=1 Tax=Rousettus aegyptiacus TaxID=9407 RepID=UPI00168CFF5F|nr:vegetative cell wall protein gp1-like [Rousettus aegyptiacus]